ESRIRHGDPFLTRTRDARPGLAVDRTRRCPGADIRGEAMTPPATGDESAVTATMRPTPEYGCRTAFHLVPPPPTRAGGMRTARRDGGSLATPDGCGPGTERGTELYTPVAMAKTREYVYGRKPDCPWRRTAGSPPTAWCTIAAHSESVHAVQLRCGPYTLANRHRSCGQHLE